MGKKSKRKQQSVVGAGGSDCVGTREFTTLTSGLEDVYFTWGTAKDAEKIEDTVSKLARHIGTSPRPQSSVASNVMSSLVTPEFEEPAVPTREYWADPGPHGQDQQEDKAGDWGRGRRQPTSQGGLGA